MFKSFMALRRQTSTRHFGVLEDMESKLRAKFTPHDLKVVDTNGDLYKVSVSLDNPII